MPFRQIDLSYVRQEFVDRMIVIRRLVDQVSPTAQAAPLNPMAIDREIRGMCLVLMYAAYENLLRMLCRSLIEHLNRRRVRFIRLTDGCQLLASHDHFKGIAAISPSSLWERGGQYVSYASRRTPVELRPDMFPDDGSHFRAKQVGTLCRLFGLGDPWPVLRELKTHIDEVVERRNAVAHGRERPEEAGRLYSYEALSKLVELWEQRLCEFIDHVQVSVGRGDLFVRS